MHCIYIISYPRETLEWINGMIKSCAEYLAFFSSYSRGVILIIADAPPIDFELGGKAYQITSAPWQTTNRDLDVFDSMNLLGAQVYSCSALPRCKSSGKTNFWTRGISLSSISCVFGFLLCAAMPRQMVGPHSFRMCPLQYVRMPSSNVNCQWNLQILWATATSLFGTCPSAKWQLPVFSYVYTMLVWFCFTFFSLISLFCFDGKASLLPLQAIPVDGREPIKEKLVEILKVKKTEGATAVALHGSVHWMHFRKL